MLNCTLLDRAYYYYYLHLYENNFLFFKMRAIWLTEYQGQLCPAEIPILRGQVDSSVVNKIFSLVFF